MRSIIEKEGFLKGNSQEIIKKLTDKELKEVALAIQIFGN